MQPRARLILAVIPVLWPEPQAWAASRPPSTLAPPRYDLSVKVLPDVPRLEVHGRVRLPPASAPRATLEMTLSAVMRDLRVEVVEPAPCAGRAALEQKKGDSSEWILHPVRPVPAGAPVLLRFSYEGGEHPAYQFDLSRQSSVALGLNTAWYPWFGHRRSTGILDLSVPIGYTAVAAGIPRNSAAGKSRGLFRYETRQPLFFSFAAGAYSTAYRPGPVPISAHLLRPRPAVHRYLEGCAKALRVLKRQFGAFPYEGFALVEVPPDQANERASLYAGTSVAGMIFVRSDMLDRPFNLAYFAHEIGHQWWGNLVLPSGPRGSMMLTEGMAQYGALQVVGAVEGAPAAEQFRREGYPGFAFQSGEGALLYSAAGLDQPLSGLRGGYVAHELANSKGFLVLDLLSRTAGRTQFRGALHEITQRFAAPGLTWQRFLDIIQARARRDLSWFYAQWFDRTGAPDWSTQWSQRGGHLRVHIDQVAPVYRAKVEVLILGARGRRQTRQVALKGTRFQADWPVTFAVGSVVVDPSFQVLHWTTEYRRSAQALAPVWHADAQRQEGRTEQAVREYQAILTRVPRPDPYGARFLAEAGLGFARADQKNWSEAKLHLEAALRWATRRPEVLPWVYLVLALAGKELGDRAAVDWAVAAARTADADPRARTGAAEAARALAEGR